MLLPDEILAAAKRHALSEFPKEACGLVVGNEYLPCENIAEEPEKDFLIDASVTEPLLIANKIQAVIHSHTFKQILERSTPSTADLRSQMATNVPWGIIDTDGEIANDPYWIEDANLDTPLIGEPFQHGVMDCYTAIRKWYWQKRGIKLIEMPREDLWWTKEDSLYVNNFERAGFCQISLDQLQDGDVVFGKINAEVINHAGIYLDNPEDGKGLLYHHLPGRLSRREPAMPWVNRAEMAVRYVD